MIFDDIFTEEQISEIENTISSYNFPWFYQGPLTTPQKTRFVSNLYDTSCMGHVIFNYDEETDKKIISPYFDFISEKILSPIFEKLDFGRVEIWRIRCNLLLKQNIEPGTHTNIHIDNSDKIDRDNGLAIIYYVNDSDGPTLLFTPYGYIEKTIEPKRGRVVVFKIGQYHAASFPIKNERRMVVNINLKKLDPV